MVNPWLSLSVISGGGLSNRLSTLQVSHHSTIRVQTTFHPSVFKAEETGRRLEVDEYPAVVKS